MTDAQINTLGRYALYALAGALIASGLKLGAALPGDAPIPWREIASVFILTLCGTLSTAVGTTTLVRPGSEPISAQVDMLRAQGTHRQDMVVLPRSQAIVAMLANGSVQPAFTPAQVTQVSDELERRMRAEPAALDDERRAEGRADPLPPSPRYPGHG